MIKYMLSQWMTVTGKWVWMGGWLHELGANGTEGARKRTKVV